MPTETRALDRARRLFEFIKRFDERRAPARRDLDEARWKLFISDLPKHPGIRLGDVEGERAEALLTIAQPETTSCPEPPAVVRDWLLTGWKDPNRDVEVTATRTVRSGTARGDDPDARVVERFESDSHRASAYDSWLAARRQWADAERPAREVAALFQDVLALWAQLQREGEALRVYAGDATLVWQRDGDTGGPVRHPLLLSEVELRLDERGRELTFIDAGRPPMLYSELLAQFEELPGEKRRLCRNIVEASGASGGCHPLGGGSTDAVVRQLAPVLGVHEVVVGLDELVEPAIDPVIQRRAVFFAVPPLMGFQSACDAFIEWIQSDAALPLAIERIVSTDAVKSGESHPSDGDAELELFFTKPANAAQQEIAKRLEQSGTVLVQGPPGTGKTHTIANLISHLLAHGRRVLVTAQTTKALRVLREKVSAPLQPLCVSVLDSDVESRSELEHAVNGIVAKLTSDVRQFEVEAKRLRSERSRLSEQITAREATLRTAILGEYEPIVVAGEQLAPSHAARLLTESGERDGWLPGPVEPMAPCPIDEAEARELYRITAELRAEDEALVAAGLPEPGDLISSERFGALASALRLTPQPRPSEFHWAPSRVIHDTDAVLRAREAALRAVSTLDGGESWVLACAQAGLQGGEFRKPWDSLVELLDSSSSRYPGLKATALEHEVRLGALEDFEGVLATADELLVHLEGGGGLGWFSLVGKKHWKSLLDAVRVRGRTPSSAEDMRAVRAALEIGVMRDRTRRRWHAVMGAAGHALPEKHAREPESYADAVLPQLKRTLRWAELGLAPAVATLEGLGVKWAALIQSVDALPPHAEVKRALLCLQTRVLPALDYEQDRLRRAHLQQELDQSLKVLPGYPGLPAARQALAAAEARDPAGYTAALEELWRLTSLHPLVHRRATLLGRIMPAAKGWADSVRARASGHEGPEIPGDLKAAWLLRQCTEELDRRQRTDIHELQRELADLRDKLRDVTAALVENLAWAAQVRRTSPREHKALMSWLDLVRRIGKGHGVRADEYKREAQRQLDVAREAVPVWIMPLSRVAESFKPGQTRFDTVILDEASQCDLRAVVAMALGASVIVVGDDEQVSPMDVGGNVAEITALQDEYLADLPDRTQFDGRSSAYEIARRAFPGGLIRLTEHFRCVPSIISFSNWLSYKGEIRPLREASSARVFPPVIAHRVVEGARGDGQVNRAEALELCSLLVAACELPAYDKLTMGVVSLLGDAQARVIDSLLQRYLDAATYRQRRILCGSPPHFQGDERDVVFLSMVNSRGEGGPLTFTDGDEYKRRFNVAASRAKDQMWVIHSLDHEKDLKAGDLRRRLLEHALNPGATAIDAESAHVESDFEKRVFAALVERGYRVRSQVEVGAYRLDLVVEDGHRRIAIECDGDRYHPLSALDADLERQAILERLGWRFLRLRGTAFYRRPEQEMGHIFKRLDELRMERIGFSAQTAAGLGEGAREQVVLRAAELRRTWLAEVESLDTLFESALPAARKGRRGGGVPGRGGLKRVV